MHPYLAMTAHWLGPRGDDHQVLLRQALLAFRRIRGAHSGQRIARIVYNILENADIINKVGHFSFFSPTHTKTHSTTFRLGILPWTMLPTMRHLCSI